ncbi:unnamed protein product [Acanthoscelides obtectus]|uniref:Uncharacterized protein n=1 Tax=Acanthoscelides obtectus TaxID=200917 RepID=A0A9P0MFQ4_ACAOB|nr:unnamed protein product [Acanthoscelides obtectus]CAK1627572.1 hypothetical protein AOBTE_LOCUS4671 [Acanthoscelides obtectus]
MSTYDIQNHIFAIYNRLSNNNINWGHINIHKYQRRTHKNLANRYLYLTGSFWHYVGATEIPYVNIPIEILTIDFYGYIIKGIGHLPLQNSDILKAFLVP